ncbi:MAG TPA: ATP-binding protein [Thiobacillaceae bacterium]|nr:ATP-binding protein [Thiobacillaceae bacterium]
MLDRLPLPAFLKRLQARIHARPDTEFQQALIRVVIGLVFLAYFSSPLAALDQSLRSTTQLVSILFTGIAILIAAFIAASQNASPARRVMAMALDYATCSFLLTYTGEAGSTLLVVYLWVTLGNGFRYGVAYLYMATGMAITGFLAVLTFSPYWSQHTSIGLAFLLSMIAVPLYTASLLKQLHSAVEHARKASMAKSSFLANMSHELRTPLNGVIGVADLLAETRLDDEQREFAQIIRASANTLLELIDNVLDIARIETGRISITTSDFDLHRLVNGTISMMETLAQRKGLVLAAHIAPQTPFRLHGDARHLRQVLINLIGNAIKFTELGRVDVYIRPVGQSQPQRVRFEIVDTGIGIPEAAQAHIFESFTQADPSITRRFGGSGLGTTIARQLVESLGGEIGLNSRVGEGTTFWFEIPFTLHTAASAVPPAQFEAPLSVAILASGELGMRLRTMIQNWGAEPVMMENAARLAAELTRRTFDGTPIGAVVVERNMLPGDPATILHLLHDEPTLAALPIILLESDASVPGPRDAQLLRDGYASVLRTPVNATLLFNAIHAATSHEMPDNVVSLADRFSPQSAAHPLRILVAEDNPINQRVIRGLLEHAGHQTFLAHDGDEALAMLESDDQAYDLAIIDMHMPGLSGPEVVQHWRFMERTHLPVIMLTADARPDAKAACEEAGVDAFLTKPVNGRELIGTIDQLASSQTRFEAPTPAMKPVALDESVLDDLAEIGGRAFAQDLLTSFEQESERLMHDIEAALANQDYGQWHDLLHMLKGGASDIGAQQLAKRCTEAEAIKPFELPTHLAGTRLDAVREALTATRAALATYHASKLRVEHR